MLIVHETSRRYALFEEEKERRKGVMVDKGGACLFPCLHILRLYIPFHKPAKTVTVRVRVRLNAHVLTFLRRLDIRATSTHDSAVTMVLPNHLRGCLVRLNRIIPATIRKPSPRVVPKMWGP